MHVIVVGCGRVGAGLALRLTEQGHGVSIIDRVPQSFHRLPDDWPGEKVVGSGFDLDDLNAAGASMAGGLAAVTSGDNTNIVAARIAREHYGIANVVARIYDPWRALIYQRLGIPTVAPVTWTIEQVMQRLVPEIEAGTWTDPTGQLVLVERQLPEAWAGRSLGGLAIEGRAKVAAVLRGGEPRLDTDGLVGQEGDMLHLIVTRDSVGDLGRLLDTPAPEPVADETADRP
ncbi:MAG: TrkA family potassium uptake protein [Acidimicrobiales bacterium]